MNEENTTFNAEEINPDDYEKIKEKIIHDDKDKHFKLYEKLRKKFRYSNSKKNNIADYLFLLPDIFFLLLRLFKDDRVSLKTKYIIGATIAYIISPIDIIPDFIPIIGYVDDLVIAIYVLNTLLNGTEDQILKDNWSGDYDLLEIVQKVSAIAEKTVSKPILNRIKKWVSRQK